LRFPVAAVAALAATVLLAVRAEALELVPGGYGAPADPASVADSLPEDRLDLGQSAGVAGMSLDFTPRHGTTLWSSDGDGEGEPDRRFDLTVTGGQAMALDQLGLGTVSPTLHPGSRGTGRTALTVGGAMRWAEWSVGGGFGRAQFLGADVDLLSASLGYGRLSAEVAFGQSVDYQTTPRDVLMLSTDLAAWSWLTLESDIALGSASGADREDESVAVGRFGLRLNF
jgi:hypothetical protein